MTFGVSFADAAGATQFDSSADTWFLHDAQTITTPTYPNTATLSYPELAGDQIAAQVITANANEYLYKWEISGINVIIGSTNLPVTLHVFVYRKGVTINNVSGYGMQIKADDGSLLISQTGKNFRMLGPITCLTTSNPAPTLLEAMATHKCTFTSNSHPPIIYVTLPVQSVNGNGASIIGMVRSGNQYTVYVLAIGITPSIFYATDFSGAAMPSYGMAIYDAGASMIWNSDHQMHNANFIRWSGNAVSAPSMVWVGWNVYWTILRYTHQLLLPQQPYVHPSVGYALGGCFSTGETFLYGSIYSPDYTIARPIYSISFGQNNYVHAYPAIVSVNPVSNTKIALYDYASTLNLNYHQYSFGHPGPLTHDFLLRK